MKRYFKIGEISKLYNIGQDSLRYYEELGIIKPKRSPKNYRMYSINDLWKLNVIRDLRKLGFSMEKIKHYLDHRSVQATEELLAQELQAIHREQQELTKLEADVKERLSTLQEAHKQILGVIEKQYVKERRCHVLQSGYDRDEEMDMLMKQLLNKDKQNLYIVGNNRIGSMLPIEKARKKEYRAYDRVFIIDEHGSEKLPAGDYISVFYQGSGDKNDIYIPEILQYTKKKGLEPAGDILELIWIDIHQAENPKEYITELQLRCESI